MAFPHTYGAGPSGALPQPRKNPFLKEPHRRIGAADVRKTIAGYTSHKHHPVIGKFAAAGFLKLSHQIGYM